MKLKFNFIEFLKNGLSKKKLVHDIATYNFYFKCLDAKNI
jgi:hypothetical protein